MYLLQTGRVELGFIGGAEIDRFGNLNTHWVEENGKRLRLPGSGGAADIATMAKRCIIIMNHEKRRFTAEGSLHHVTWIRRRRRLARARRSYPAADPAA